nr:MAG TPA: hypothetical protein [Caudoviricetes sp.]
MQHKTRKPPRRCNTINVGDPHQSERKLKT